MKIGAFVNYLLSLITSAAIATLGCRRRQLKAVDVVEVKHLQHLLSVGINFNDVMLQGRDLRNIVVTSLTLLFLQFDRDSSDLRVSEAPHQVGGKPGTIVLLEKYNFNQFFLRRF